jgi:PhzF family phenazine biosynthesis protein
VEVGENSEVARRFTQVDVFTHTALQGNPVAVVHDADGLDDETMQRVARWTNLSETTFLLPPTQPGADYRVRIFMPTGELPFAGHPTLGTCHAWLEAGGVAAGDDVVVQECGVGLVPITRTEHGLAFAAPPRRRSGPVEPAIRERAAAAVGLPLDSVLAAEWLDNGPEWVGLLVADAHTVLALRPGPVDLDVGVVGFHPTGSKPPSRCGRSSRRTAQPWRTR